MYPLISRGNTCQHILKVNISFQHSKLPKKKTRNKIKEFYKTDETFEIKHTLDKTDFQSFTLNSQRNEKFHFINSLRSF